MDLHNALVAIREGLNTRPAEPTAPKVRKAECSQCGGLRNCDIRGEYTVSSEEREHSFQAWKTWYILECRGCEHVFVQTASANSEDWDWNGEYDADGAQVMAYNESLRTWPALSRRKRPEWMKAGEIEAENFDRLSYALRELYKALNDDLNMLAALGIRTSFDIAAQLLGIDPEQTFKEKLEELVVKGLIGKVDKERLEILVEAGNASAHRGWHPNTDELKTLMDILEHFIHDAFVAPHRKTQLDINAAKVKTMVPVRTPKLKTRNKTAPEQPKA